MGVSDVDRAKEVFTRRASPVARFLVDTLASSPHKRTGFIRISNDLYGRATILDDKVQKLRMLLNSMRKRIGAVYPDREWFPVVNGTILLSRDLEVVDD